MIKLTAAQQQVVDAINQLNEEQGVASSVYVSALTGLTLTYTRQLCQSLKQLGVVSWEPDVPSLVVIPSVEIEDGGELAPAVGEETGDRDAEGEKADEQERKRRIRNEALARGRATAAANRAAKAAHA